MRLGAELEVLEFLAVLGGPDCLVEREGKDLRGSRHSDAKSLFLDAFEGAFQCAGDDHLLNRVLAEQHHGFVDVIDFALEAIHR